MDKESRGGNVEIIIKEIFWKIKGMAMVFSSGMMVGSTKENGRMGSNME